MLRNIVIIIIILVILVLSQQAFFQKIGKDYCGEIEEWGRAIWQKCEDFWNKNISHRVTSEIEKRENIAKEEINEQTEKAAQNVFEKIKTYISGLFRGLFNKTVPEQNK